MNVEQDFARGVGLHQAGKVAEAEAVYRAVLQTAPNHAAAMNYLGLILFHRGGAGEKEEAYGWMKRSVELQPGVATFWANFGGVCRGVKRNEEAQRAYERSLAMDPRAAATWNNLGNLHADMGRLEPAIEALGRALELDSRQPNTRVNLAKVYADAGRNEESVAEFRRALAEVPDSGKHSDFLLNLHYDPTQTAEMIYAEHVRWTEMYVTSSGAREMVRREEDGERMLKMGYVSADFREHPAAHVMLPLLEHHDRAKFKVHLYSTVKGDGLTERFRRAADVFRDVEKLNAEELAEVVRGDGIDVLVECGNHTGGNRLLTFARQPATVQFTAFGLPSTTGLAAIDYRLTDSYFDPAGDVGGGKPSAEELVRIDPCAWCYDPGEDVPEVGELPMTKNGYVTFGSLNNVRKMSELAVRMWATVLKRVEGSKFLVVTGAVAGLSAFGLERVVGLFAKEGIGRERLVTVDRVPRREYFLTHGRVDVELDAFPFCGGVTTLDALYMGVPVVTLGGRTYTSRTGVSILSNVGLSELAAGTEEEFVEKAVGLAGDRARMEMLRGELRGKLKASVLMDGAAYARRVEAAYREKWRQRVSAR